MIKKTKKVNFKDQRGYIQDILTQTNIEHATLIFSKKGAIRGNHYHKKTKQYIFVLSGLLEYHYLAKNKNHKNTLLRPGDLVETPAMEPHALKILEDSEFLALTSGIRGGKDYELDTYHLEKPII